MYRIFLKTNRAPRPLGPISQGVSFQGFVFAAGQGGFDPETRALDSGIESQTRQTLENVDAVLREGGASLGSAIRISIYLTSSDDFAEMNRVYEELVPEPRPARTTVIVNLVVPGMLVEIDAIAAVEGD